MAAKILTREPQKDPFWMRVLDRYGISTLILLVIMYGGWKWFGNYLEKEKDRAEVESALISAQINSSQIVAESVKKLAESVQERRNFEAMVQQTHVKQTEQLEKINESLLEAYKMMEPTSKMREEEIKILSQIRDKVSTDG